MSKVRVVYRKGDSQDFARARVLSPAETGLLTIVTDNGSNIYRETRTIRIPLDLIAWAETFDD